MPDQPHIAVKNYAKFQNHRNKRPPWIKLYNDILDGDFEEYLELSDAHKCHLIHLWMLASRYENKIPYRPAWLQRRLNVNEPLDLAALVSAGVIVIHGDTSTSRQRLVNDTSTARLQLVAPEGEGEGEDKLLSSTGVEERAQTYKTKKGKTLSGDMLSMFERFWDVFGYKNGRAEAADPWREGWDEIKANLPRVLDAARAEAVGRPALIASGHTPKMAQGWLSGRRWENEGIQVEEDPDEAAGRALLAARAADRLAKAAGAIPNG